MATVLTGQGIRMFQFRAQLGALRLEAIGMKRRGRSMKTIVAETYGITGRTAADVVPKFESFIEEWEAKNDAAIRAGVHTTGEVN